MTIRAASERQVAIFQERRWGGTAFMRVNYVFDQSVVSQVGLPETGRSFFAGLRLER